MRVCMCVCVCVCDKSKSGTSMHSNLERILSFLRISVCLILRLKTVPETFRIGNSKIYINNKLNPARIRDSGSTNLFPFTKGKFSNETKRRFLTIIRKSSKVPRILSRCLFST